MKTNILALKQYISDREAAGLPIASAKQLEAARKLIAQNPTLRSAYNSPLGLHILVERMPLDKRAKLRNRLSEEEGGIGLTLEPRKVRGDHVGIEPDQDMVAGFCDANPSWDERDAALAICGTAGYTDPAALNRRVERFANSSGQGRPATHILEKVRIVGAMAAAIEYVRARNAAVTAVGQIAQATAS